MKHLCRAALLGLGLVAAMPLASLVHADETSAAKKVYVGTIDVKPEQRDDLIARLKDLELKGEVEPSKTSPATIIYRGTREEFRTAAKAAEEFHFPELASTTGKQTKKTKPSSDKPGNAERDAKDEEILSKIGISEEKKQKFRELKIEADKRAKDLPKNTKRMTPEIREKSMQYNIWWNGELRKIFTEEELRKYMEYWSKQAGNKAQPRPANKTKKNIKPASPFSGQTDEDVFEKMKLTDKERQGVEKLLAERAKSMEEFQSIEDSQEKMEAGQKINRNWNNGLKKVLGEERYQEYSQYWEKPESIR